MRGHHDPELKGRALAMLAQGKTQREVAAGLNLSRATLQSWLRKARKREDFTMDTEETEEEPEKATTTKRGKSAPRNNGALEVTVSSGETMAATFKLSGAELPKLLGVLCGMGRLT